MSLLSEIVIKPVESKSYLRLILAIYLLTVCLIFYSSLFFVLKLLLTGFIAYLLRTDIVNKSPDNGIQAIECVRNEWVLTLNDGKKMRYNEAHILINNTLFQLIQFKAEQHKRLVVLFHDQVSNQQLRVLQLKIAQN